ncbi:MAG: cupin-like domain-containing protein [Pseudomonadales bacterium]|nr:cupin-like domain-containing protein [Pseudomonadales bacterium]
MAMWLGPTGHTEPLHWDCGEGTVLMLSGAKKVVLFAPEQSANLYPFPLYGGPAAPWFSKVYVENPDLTAFPKYREAEKHKIEITLNAGEVLYIPVYWWHELSSIGSGDYTCSVNRFWRVKPMRRLSRNKVGMALYLTQMGLMSVNRLAQSLR